MNRDRESAGLVVASSVASALFGIIVGYVLGTGSAVGSAPQAPYGPPAASTVAQSAPVGLASEPEVQAYRDILARDPQNLKAATGLGNLLYDAGRYAEAIAPYQQAFALDPANANLSTDLGTALWYAGRPDDALAQYQKSLAAEPTHPQTLFNMGLVSLQGKQDAFGAIQAWERLLATTPDYPEADKVRRLLADARAKMPPLTATRTGR